MEINSQKAVHQSESPADRQGMIDTLYSVGSWSIFWRNFLAGISRAFGAIVMYLLFITVLSYLFMQYLYPQVAPFLSSYQELMQAVSGPSSSQSNSPEQNLPPDVQNLTQDPLFQQLLQKYQK